MSLEPAKIQDSLKFGGDFEIDFAAGQLRRSGRILKVERIPMDVLLFLVQHRRELVTTVGGALFSDNYPIFQFLEKSVRAPAATLCRREGVYGSFAVSR